MVHRLAAAVTVLLTLTVANLLPPAQGLWGASTAEATGGACIARLSVQDEYGIVAAKSGVYFQRKIHKPHLTDWVSISDNRPWGGTVITDIDLTEQPKGLATLGTPQAMLIAANSVYLHRNLLETALLGNDWTLFDLNRPWGQLALGEIGIAGDGQAAKVRAVASAASNVYFSLPSAPNPQWVDVSDNRPWGNLPVLDTDVTSESRGMVTTRDGRIYIHHNLEDLGGQDWVPAETAITNNGGQLTGATRVDWDFRPAVAARGSDVFYTQWPLFNDHRGWSNISDNRPWENTSIDDVSVFFWTQEEPWNTPSIVLVAAGDRPYLHQRPEGITEAIPEAQWLDVSDNAPWLARGGECSTEPAFQCSDGLDNDGDGAVDHPNDFSCSSPDDDDETHPKAQCQDGVDNDGDGKIDARDPGCHTDGNPDNAGSYNPQDNDESDGGTGPQLSVEKDGPSEVERGKEISYTIKAENKGGGTALDVILTDFFPADLLTYLSPQRITGCALSGSGAVRCEIGTFDVGQTRTFTHVFRVKEDAACEAQVQNKADLQARDGLLVWVMHTARITCPDGDPDPNNITIDLRDLKDPVEPNQTFNYEIQLTNLNAQELKNLTVTQSLDGQTTFVSASDGGTETSGVIKWTNVSIPGNGQTTLQSTVRVKDEADDGDVLNSTAFSGSKSDSETTTVREDGDDDGGDDGGDDEDLTLTITDHPDPVAPLEVLQYRIRLCNERSSDRTLDVTAFLDPDTFFLDASDDGDERGDDEVRWDDIRVDGDDCRELDLDVEVSDRVFEGDRLRIRARAAEAEDTEFTSVIDDDIPPPPPPHCRPPRRCPPPPPLPPGGGHFARVDVDKRASSREAKPGDIVTYTVEVRNVGDLYAGELVLEDRFTAGSIAITEAGGGRVLGSGIEWNAFDLAPDETRVFTYQARVGREMRHGEVILNSVSVHGPDLDRSATDVEEVRIVTTFPQTGFGGFFTTWQSTRAALSGKNREVVPVSSSESSALPFIFWMSIMGLGISAGGVIGRKFIP